MAVAQMAKRNSPGRKKAGEGNANDKTTVRLGAKAVDLVYKLAGMRRKTPAELFEMEDIENYLVNLLLEEMRLEAERRQGQTKP